ncbi:MAG: glycolate oxidase subunit GlcF, partial [Gammaproteobacteria bacterium]|nr:glycolate oxidase subunit GlcF [Gammaproteobacteria bacterium]
KCVHCGFCTATCPTYQLLGDELDGPRGRIYLIKNLLEENTISDDSIAHLDRCLTCRACETTCPSGVEYGRLLDIGREFVKDHANRPLRSRMLTFLLRLVVPRPALFAPLLKLGQFFRPLLPAFIKRHVPTKMPVLHQVEPVIGAKVVLLSGCVQSAATPNVVASLLKVLHHQGMDAEVFHEGCCGALDYHLSAHEAGMQRMKAVIDQLYPRIDHIDYIVSSATGCGVTIRDYPEILQYDAEYRDKASAIVDKLVDPIEIVSGEAIEVTTTRVAVHTPCSMQHGLGLTGAVEKLLGDTGFDITPHREGHLCCGSAGTYSVLQPELSQQLKARKLNVLGEGKPDVIVTANVGCQLQLKEGANVPVMHWLELLAEQI